MRPTEEQEPDLERIAREIESSTSPVGIDARKTHVLILAALERIEARLARIESGQSPSPDP